jgi:hypothetical protein
MTASEALSRPEVKKLVEGLKGALGDRLLSVVLYGSAARGDFQEGRSDINLLLVVGDLLPLTLQQMSPAIRGWLGKGQPAPRLFTPSMVSESADVFPIELLDLENSRVLLHGEDFFDGVPVNRSYLRLQCERELRVKLMRLREAYIECHDRPKDLEGLLIGSYTTFTALFRGCLYLLGGPSPLKNAEVAEAFCRQAKLDPAPFAAVDKLKRGQPAEEDLKALYGKYHEQLARAVDRVDHFVPQGGDRR